MTQSDRELFEALIRKHGEEHQFKVAVEELLELALELVRSMRGNGSTWKICDELADAGIVLDQIRIITDPTGAREKMYRRYKLSRIRMRNIEGGQP